MEWQPISTAPRDGTDVLLSQKYLRDEPFIGWWCDKRKQWRPDFSAVRAVGDAYLEADLGPQEGIDFWMPLPNAPTT